VYATTASHIVLGVTALVLLYAAFTDLREFKIRNDLVLLLCALFILHAVVSGRWTTLPWNQAVVGVGTTVAFHLAVALVAFAIMLYCYAQNLMGGGDVKILAVGYLWVGLSCALVFSISMLGLACLHALMAKLEWPKIARMRADRRIPFAPAVAGALIITFLTGCLDAPQVQLPNFRRLSDRLGAHATAGLHDGLRAR
jgi:prepilin peptidase CpaA